MLTRLDDLGDDTVAAAVGERWGVGGDVEYLPVGFGSFHWRVGDRFVTVDDLRSVRLGSLTAALGTARRLADAGYSFVVAPEPTVDGEVVHVVDRRFAVAVYPWIEGERHEWGTRPPGWTDAVLALLGELHAAPPELSAGALVDDLVIEGRAELDDLAGAWDGGPYGEPARRLLVAHRRAIDDALARYDELAAVVPERLVLTHGEPHPGNTISTAGGLVLVDWDTVRLASPARDLWDLVDGAGEQYRLRWALTEIALGAARFKRPHGVDPDTELAWAGLQRYVEEIAAGRSGRGGSMPTT